MPFFRTTQISWQYFSILTASKNSYRSIRFLVNGLERATRARQASFRISLISTVTHVVDFAWRGIGSETGCRSQTRQDATNRLKMRTSPKWWPPRGGSKEPALAQGIAQLEAWPVSFRVGMILAGRALDQGLYSELDELALAAGNNLYLTLAISSQQRKLLRISPRNVVERTFRLLADRRVTIELGDRIHGEQEVLAGIIAIVESAFQYGVATKEVLAATLSRYLTDAPSYGLNSRFRGQRTVLLRAYSLRSALRGEQLTVKDLANAKVREALENNLPQADSQEVREFREEIGALLPWHALRTRQLLAPLESEQLSKALDNAKSESSISAQYSYRERSFTSDEIAELWFEIWQHRAGGTQPTPVLFTTGWRTSDFLSSSPLGRNWLGWRAAYPGLKTMPTTLFSDPPN